MLKCSLQIVFTLHQRLILVVEKHSNDKNSYLFLWEGGWSKRLIVCVGLNPIRRPDHSVTIWGLLPTE